MTSLNTLQVEEILVTMTCVKNQFY